jgi:hypothetical protein
LILLALSNRCRRAAHEVTSRSAATSASEDHLGLVPYTMGLQSTSRRRRSADFLEALLFSMLSHKGAKLKPQPVLDAKSTR